MLLIGLHYLISQLNLQNAIFELTKNEQQYVRISNIDNKFKLDDGSYLLDAVIKFLNKYNFGSDFVINQKTDNLINSAVLSLVYEKLNGYKDGSHFTPNLITDFMSEQSIKNSVLDNVNNYLKNNEIREISNIEELKDYLITLKIQRNKMFDDISNIINNIKIIDPTVGSGRFLTSCLNELLRLKLYFSINNKNYIYTEYDSIGELRFFTDENLEEEIIYKKSGNKYEYISEQKNIFEMKKFIIENQLFGVDINPNSVEITKLRLWIELLKSTYYDKKGNLVTLPNIETNIKVGNSLVNHIDFNLKKKKGFLIEPNDVKIYKNLLSEYKEIGSKDFKFKLKKEIKNIKDKVINEKIDFEINRLETKIRVLKEAIKQEELFEVKTKKEEIKVVSNSIRENEEKIKELKMITANNNMDTSFEWAIEFPELLNEKGEFIGFDVVIANPPYGVSLNKEIYRDLYKLKSNDSYGAFIKRCIELCKKAGIINLIVSDTFRSIISHKPLRKYMLAMSTLKSFIKLNRYLFKGIDVFTIIISLKRSKAKKNDKYLFYDLWQINPYENSDYFNENFDIIKNDFIGNKDLKLDSNRFGRYIITQNSIKIDNNITFFDANENIHNLLSNKCELKNIFINDKKIEGCEIELNKNTILILELGKISSIVQGLATGWNSRYIFRTKNINSKEYKLLSTGKILTKGDLENLTNKEKEAGINPDKYDGKFIVPYDKGGKNEIEEGFLSKYYQPTQYYIDWSKESVNDLKTLTVKDVRQAQGKVIGKGDENKVASRFQNKEFYFKEGITYSTTGLYSPTFRLSNGGVPDQKGSIIFSEIIDNKLLLGILNSKLAMYLIKGIISTNIDTNQDALKKFPIVYDTGKSLNTKIIQEVEKIIDEQKKDLKYDFSKNQEKIDKYVYELYNLSQEDINEVKTWYRRRYPKLNNNKIL